MARFEHIFFVCTNDRGADSPKKSCAGCGGIALLDSLKQLVKDHNLRQQVRVTRAGCLDLCQRGCVVAVFSRDAAIAQTWYSQVTPADAEALFTSHVLHNTPLARLVQTT